jgi:poly(A) polymerase
MKQQGYVDERGAALEVIARLQGQGHTAYFAGGCVRDMLLGRTIKDYDVATSARPKEIQRLFRKTLKIGIQFGIVVAVLGPYRIEIATFRSDGQYEDGRRPSSVIYSDPEEDAARRDFTVNALFYDPLSERILDSVGGREDLWRGVLRAIGDAETRLREDHLRLLRAVRFTARLGFRLGAETSAAVTRLAPLITKVSPERIREELEKILCDPSGAEGLRLAVEHGLFDALDAALAEDLRPRLARACRELALLGGRGHPSLCFAIICGDAARAEGLLRRLRASNELRDRTVAALRVAPDYARYPQLSLAARKRLLRLRFGSDHRAFARLRALSGDGDLSALAEAALDFRRYGERGDGSLYAPLLVTGDDLKAAGLRPGRHFKVLLDVAEDAQLEGLEDRSGLLELLRERFPEQMRKA